MTRWAYLVIWVAPETATIVGVGIYSEKHVTSDGKYLPFAIAEDSGDTYDEAYQRVRSRMENPRMEWLLRLYRGRGLSEVAPAAVDEAEPGRNDEYASPQIIDLGEALKRSMGEPGRNGE